MTGNEIFRVLLYILDPGNRVSRIFTADLEILSHLIDLRYPAWPWNRVITRWFCELQDEICHPCVICRHGSLHNGPGVWAKTHFASECEYLSRSSGGTCSHGKWSSNFSVFLFAPASLITRPLRKTSPKLVWILLAPQRPGTGWRNKAEVSRS